MWTDLVMFEKCHGLGWQFEVQQEQELLSALPFRRGILGQWAELPFWVDGWSYNMLMSLVTICQCDVQPSSNQMVYEAPKYTRLKNSSFNFFLHLRLLLTPCCIGREVKMFCGLSAPEGNTFYRNKNNPRFCERLSQTLSRYCAGYLLQVHMW